MNPPHTLQAHHLRTITQQMLHAAGTPDPIAASVAAILINANLAGHDSHGVLRVPVYLRQIEEGTLQPAAEPQIVDESENRLLIDGGHGFGHYTAQQAMLWAIDKARTNTICCVSLVNTGHIGRLGEYAEIVARAGCLGMITVGSGGKGVGSVAPYGGALRALGTNPIAVGAPTGDETPFVLDFATSVVAHGKIMVARSRHADLPAGTIVDEAGNPSVDPEDFYTGGHLLTFGKHKGYALSLLVCLLGGLTGNFNAESATMGGGYMQVINIDAFTPLAEYQQHVRTFLDGMKSTPPANGFDEVLAPGDFEFQTRQQRLADGIEVPDTIYQQLQRWADKLQVSLIEEKQ